jgi:prepilin-type N-terminal cleavage/methylation domain-containing protein
MKHPTTTAHAGFSLAEMLVSTAAASILLAAIITTSISLQRSFRAVDQYFATHIQQVRIIDYLSRDVKRGLSVTTSVDKQSVTVTLPNYIIVAGDPEAAVDPSRIGTQRQPTITRTSSGWQVNYGTALSTVTYVVEGLSILRSENGVITTIASSTDQLVPQTTNVELANTRFASTTVTFQPLFAAAPTDASRYGTTVCATSYLRNRRRA